MFKKTREAFGDSVLAMIELAGLLLSSSGTAAALLLGKLFLAVVLGVIAFGIILRFVRRRARAGAS